MPFLVHLLVLRCILYTCDSNRMIYVCFSQIKPYIYIGEPHLDMFSHDTDCQSGIFYDETDFLREYGSLIEMRMLPKCS